MSKIIFILSIVLFAITHSYAVPSITEIKPQGDEFVEIHANSSLNLSDVKIYDSNGESSFNTVEKIQSSSSSFILIAGENFIENNNISNLNCDIYQTSGTQVSKGGLLSGGEELRINNSKYFFNWTPKKDFDLASNQSIDAQFHEKTTATPCDYNKLPKGDSKNNQHSFEEKLTCSCPNFSINTSKKITNSTLQYQFETNEQDPLIEYWVESYNGSIVKQKRNTTSLSTKYFTPSQMDVYTIKANLYSSKCSMYSQEEVVFHKKPESTPHTNKNSSITIENKQSLENSKEDEIICEISRGDTRKRVVKFYRGDQEFGSLYLKKFSNISGRITIPENSDSNTLYIKGLGVNQTINLYEQKKSNKNDKSSGGSSSQKESQQSSGFTSPSTQQSKKLEIFPFNISQQKNALKFSINTTHKANMSCYLINDMTQLSDEISTIQNTTLRNYSLVINKQKILKQNKTLGNELFCKYKKPHLKTQKSLRTPVNISFNNQTNSQNDTDTVFKTQNSTTFIEKTLNNKNNSTQNNSIQSTQIEWREYTIYGFVGILLILIAFFIVFW